MQTPSLLIKLNTTELARTPGALKGKIKIANDFDELPDDFMNYFAINERST